MAGAQSCDDIRRKVNKGSILIETEYLNTRFLDSLYVHECGMYDEAKKNNRNIYFY